VKLLETSRLLLRKWDMDSDLLPFTAIVQDPSVMEYYPALGDEEWAKGIIKVHNEQLDKNGLGLLACVLKSTREFIGYTGLMVPGFQAHFTPCVEIGWRLAHHAWGKGYATEAAQAALTYGFTQRKLEEIVSFTVPQNLRSRRVMEKLGMTHDEQENFAHPRLPKEHPLSIHVLYRLKKADWEKNLSRDALA
jgi:RimJ/RimL family protein N-acetyltransferase